MARAPVLFAAFIICARRPVTTLQTQREFSQSFVNQHTARPCVATSTACSGSTFALLASSPAQLRPGCSPFHNLWSAERQEVLRSPGTPANPHIHAEEPETNILPQQPERTFKLYANLLRWGRLCGRGRLGGRRRPHCKPPPAAARRRPQRTKCCTLHPDHGYSGLSQQWRNRASETKGWIEDGSTAGFRPGLRALSTDGIPFESRAHICARKQLPGQKLSTSKSTQSLYSLPERCLGMADEKWRLQPHPSIPRPDKPLLVVVLDGWGEGTHNDDFNAIYKADTPCMDSLKHGAPQRWRLLKAHGTAVGLPTDDDMGNSEVGKQERCWWCMLCGPLMPRHRPAGLVLKLAPSSGTCCRLACTRKDTAMT